MFCTNCGKEIPNDSRVCGYCGKPIKNPTQTENGIDTLAQYQNNQQYQNDQPNYNVPPMYNNPQAQNNMGNAVLKLSGY